MWVYFRVVARSLWPRVFLVEEVDAGFEAVGGVGVTEDFGADAAAEVGYAGVVGDDVLQE